MLNILWPLFIIISFIFAFITGNVEKINNSFFESVKNAVELCITFFGTICLWNGIMKIAQKTSLLLKLNKIMKPFINIIFPEFKNNEKIKSEITMNIVSNILGLGNAATPFGIKAMKSMQKENINKDTLSDPMAMFILINTASIQIIPTTVIGIRSSMNSSNPTGIIFYVWISSILAMTVAIILGEIFIKINRRK